MFPHSIRWRLQLWIGFLLVCLLSGFGLTAYHLHRTNQLTEIDQELQRRVEVLSNALRNRVGGEPRPLRSLPGTPGRRGPPPPGEEEPFERRPPPPGRNSGPGPGPGPGPERPGPMRELVLPPSILNLFEPSSSGNRSFYFLVWSRGGGVLLRSTNAPVEMPLPTPPLTDGATHNRERAFVREAFYFNSLGECVLAGADVTAESAALRQFALLLLAAGGAVLVLGLGGGWWLTAHAIRPVEDISAAASRISAGNLSERISVAETDNELSRLAGVLNRTFARLEEAFVQQKQFTADASHELRTPIAVLISEAQTTMARERSSGEYKETISAMLATAQQMRQLTDSLLTLARLDAGHEPLLCAAFEFAEETRTCLELVRPLATERGLHLQTNLSPTSCHGDAGRLRQVITNLLTNAIHYTPAGGEIRVTTQTQDEWALLTVADTGVGISPEALPHIFERFYRADRARSRAEGRSGLGLAISKAIIDAHGGRIEAFSQGAGSAFTVRLPRKGNA